jgi:hypothetical protein
MFRNPQPSFLRAALVVLFVTLAVIALFYWLLGVAKYQDQKIPVSNVTVVSKSPAPDLSRYLRQRWYEHHMRLQAQKRLRYLRHQKEEWQKHLPWLCQQPALASHLRECYLQQQRPLPLPVRNPLRPPPRFR